MEDAFKYTITTVIEHGLRFNRCHGLTFPHFKFDAFEHDVYLEQFMERLNFFEEGHPTRPKTKTAKLVKFSNMNLNHLHIPSHIPPFRHLKQSFSKANSKKSKSEFKKFLNSRYLAKSIRLLLSDRN